MPKKPRLGGAANRESAKSRFRTVPRICEARSVLRKQRRLGLRGANAGDHVDLNDVRRAERADRARLSAHGGVTRAGLPRIALPEFSKAKVREGQDAGAPGSLDDPFRRRQLRLLHLRTDAE